MSLGNLYFLFHVSLISILMQVATRDLKHRGFRDDRLASFEYKQEA